MNPKTQQISEAEWAKFERKWAHEEKRAQVERINQQGRGKGARGAMLAEQRRGAKRIRTVKGF